MREPVLWRTDREHAPLQLRHLALAPLAKAFSVVGLCSALLLSAAQPVQASSDNSQVAIESSKAASGLLLDVVRAGKRLVTVGARGHILFSEDAGRNWVQARVPTQQLLTAVYFVDDKNGWAVGHDAQILATEDGGANWKLQFEDPERESPLLDVWFADTQVGYAVGAYGMLLETTDGGKTWEDAGERLDNEDGYHLNGITAVRDAGLFVTGEQGSMFRSRDWGQSWERIEGPYEGTFFGAVGTAASNTLLAYGLRGNLYRSSDFGDSWQAIQLLSETGPMEYGLAGASLLKDGTVAIVGHGGSVLTSKDAGRTFSIANRRESMSLSGVVDDLAGNLLLVGQGGFYLANSTGHAPEQKQ